MAVGVVHDRIRLVVAGQEVGQVLALTFGHLFDDLQLQDLVISSVDFPLMAVAEEFDTNIELIARSPFVETHGQHLAVLHLGLLVHDVEVAVAGDVAVGVVGDRGRVDSVVDGHHVILDDHRFPGVQLVRLFGLGRLFRVAAGADDRQQKEAGEQKDVLLHDRYPL